MPTMPIVQTWSACVWTTCLPIWTRWSLGSFRPCWYSATVSLSTCSESGGSVPSLPLDRNHFEYSMPNVPPPVPAVVSGSRQFGFRKGSSTPYTLLIAAMTLFACARSYSKLPSTKSLEESIPTFTQCRRIISPHVGKSALLLVDCMSIRTGPLPDGSIRKPSLLRLLSPTPSSISLPLSIASSAHFSRHSRPGKYGLSSETIVQEGVEVSRKN